MRSRAVLPVVLAAIGLGCRAITGDEIQRERQLAVVRHYDNQTLVEIPSHVTSGVDFDVSVRTFGGGCIGQGDTEVSVSGRSAEVRPYDVFVTHLPANMACTDDLRLYLHRARLRFAEPGLATVRVRGREQPGDRVIVIEQTVVVR